MRPARGDRTETAIPLPLPLGSQRRYARRAARVLNYLGEALFLRNRIIARLEQAELQPDVQHRRWLTTFVMPGGGLHLGIYRVADVAGVVSAAHPHGGARITAVPRVELGDVFSAGHLSLWISAQSAA